MKFSYDMGYLPNRMENAEIFRVFKNSGIETVAYNLFCLNNRKEVLACTDYIQNAEKLRKELDSFGISCNQTYSPFSLKLCDERINRFEPNYGELVRALEFSSIIGAKRMVCFAVQVPQGTDQIDKNKRIYRSLIPYCEKFGIEIAICSGFPKYMYSSVLKTPWQTTDEYVDFINSFNSDYITACANLGALEGFQSPPQNFVLSVGTPLLKSIHFQDVAKYHDAHMPTFSKQFDFAQIMKSLESIGYEGEFTFECPAFIERYPRELLGDLCEFLSDIGKYITGLSEEGAE